MTEMGETIEGFQTDGFDVAWIAALECPAELELIRGGEAGDGENAFQ